MPRKPSDTVQTAVRLPRAMHERLKSSSLGVSEEIRSRLERTVAEDADPATGELVAGILSLAELIRADLGAHWHESTNAHQAFTAAVAQRLAGYSPVEPPSSAGGKPTGASALLFDPPEIVGRTHERHDQRS